MTTVMIMTVVTKNESNQNPVDDDVGNVQCLDQTPKRATGLRCTTFCDVVHSTFLNSNLAPDLALIASLRRSITVVDDVPKYVSDVDSVDADDGDG